MRKSKKGQFLLEKRVQGAKDLRMFFIAKCEQP